MPNLHDCLKPTSCVCVRTISNVPEMAGVAMTISPIRFVDNNSGGVPEATPLASGPRNDGQFCACAYEAGVTSTGERDERGLEKRRKR